MPKESIQAILRGGYKKAYEAGVIITGGHTIHDQEPKYGLSVSGFVHPQKILTKQRGKTWRYFNFDQTVRSWNFNNISKG